MVGERGTERRVLPESFLTGKSNLYLEGLLVGTDTDVVCLS